MRRGKYGVLCDDYIEDNVKFIRTKCECGHTITFLTTHPRICTYCGKLIYPRKQDEFKEKLKREMRKYEQSHN